MSICYRLLALNRDVKNPVLLMGNNRARTIYVDLSTGPYNACFARRRQAHQRDRLSGAEDHQDNVAPVRGGQTETQHRNYKSMMAHVTSKSHYYSTEYTHLTNNITTVYTTAVYKCNDTMHCSKYFITNGCGYVRSSRYRNCEKHTDDLADNMICHEEYAHDDTLYPIIKMGNDFCNRWCEASSSG